MTSKRALEYLAADLKNIEADLQTLESSISELEAKREAALIKRRLLMDALGDAGTELLKELDKMPPAVVIPTAVNGARGYQEPGSGQPEEISETGGFRAAIRSVLGDAKRGMKPKDICAELVKRGVPFTGKVLPLTRTYNELWRMSKKGQLKKRATLYYAQEAA